MITLDFETRSAKELRGKKAVGIWNYVSDPTTEPICLAYKIGDSPIRLWAPDRFSKLANYKTDSIDPLFEAIDRGDLLEAHNVSFERNFWSEVMVKRFQWPEVPFKNWRCSMARAAACGLPQSLEKMALALDLPVKKDMAGSRAMKRLTRPAKIKKKDLPGQEFLFDRFDGHGFAWHEDPKDIRLTLDYCKNDVLTEYEGSKRLPELTDKELEVWLLDQKINSRGIQVDRELCESAVEVTRQLRAKANREVAKLTNGEITATTQNAKLVKYLNEKGIKTDSIAKERVDDLLRDVWVQGTPRKVLEIRQAVAASSLDKYPRMLSLSDASGIMREVLAYYGAFTGRWAGRGAQIQNFPRVTPNLIDELVSIVKTGDAELIDMIFGDPIEAIKSLLRCTLTARPNRRLLVWDFGQIEARVIGWLARDPVSLEIFASGKDPYVASASEIYEKDYDRVTGDERQVGKWAVLGLGYQMGGERFQEQLSNVGVNAPLEFCCRVVYKFRDKFEAIAELWERLNKAALNTVRTGRASQVNAIRFAIEGDFLTCRLPSGRKIYYFKPEISQKTRAIKTKTGFKQIEVDELRYLRVKNGRLFRASTYGGKLAENITQAVARDFMAEGMLRLEANGYEIVGTVHDEVIAEVDQDDTTKTVSNGTDLLEMVPVWADGCPIIADGFETIRYRKG